MFCSQTVKYESIISVFDVHLNEKEFITNVLFLFGEFFISPVLLFEHYSHFYFVYALHYLLESKNNILY